MKQTPEERRETMRKWRASNPEAYERSKKRAAAAMTKKRNEIAALKASCCERKTDLIRGKGRLITQCNKCKAMIDLGPEPEPFDRFTPVYDAEDRKSEFNSFGQYIGEK